MKFYFITSCHTFKGSILTGQSSLSTLSTNFGIMARISQSCQFGLSSSKAYIQHVYHLL